MIILFILSALCKNCNSVRYQLVTSSTSPVCCVGVQVNKWLPHICKKCVSTFVRKSFDGTSQSEIFTNRTLIERIKTFGNKFRLKFKMKQADLKDVIRQSRMDVIIPHNHGNEDGQCAYRDCLFFITKKLLVEIAKFLLLNVFLTKEFILYFDF